uniref:Poly(A) polymerase catalytic subunit domain-containing protein n=1 Tax=viral metagenome TaxID=1070528 RepID=A0A6C0IJ66_9ZZZZ
MEEESKNIHYLPKEKLLEQRLEKAVSQAEEILNYESAHNEELQQALNIVKKFIQKKQRICYGGTAINMLLPKNKRFYDPNLDLPDYDFFSPSIDKDVLELVGDLQKAGFREVIHRVGMHEGTKKILVNFIAVADISYLDKQLYNIYLKESQVIEGIHYTSPDMLRMMMYLELSRPRGEVSRWSKVYERLELLNNNFPLKSCKKVKTHPDISEEIRQIIFDFIITHERILTNIELESIYKKSLGTKKLDYSFNKGFKSVIVFFSPDLKKDAFDLKQLFDKDSLRILYVKEKGDLIQERIELYSHSLLIAVLVKESACHSYNNIKTENNRLLKIASLDTIINLYYSLHYFSNFKVSMCSIASCIKTLKSLRLSKISQFPSFSIECSGYQKGYPTLLREKLLRIQKEKEKKKTLKKKRE